MASLGSLRLSGQALRRGSDSLPSRHWNESRPWRNHSGRSLTTCCGTRIVEPLPDLQEVRDADDRLYAARSWRAVRNSQWYLDFLAAGAVREELGEAVRKECIAGLVELSTDVGTALEALATALVSMTFPDEETG